MSESLNTRHRERTIFRNDRAGRSLFDRFHILEEIERHKTEPAEQLERRHAFNPAMSAEKTVPTELRREDRNPVNQHDSRYRSTIAGELPWTSL